jgi:hypothetical protein
MSTVRHAGGRLLPDIDFGKEIIAEPARAVTTTPDSQIWHLRSPLLRPRSISQGQGRLRDDRATDAGVGVGMGSVEEYTYKATE